MKRGSLLVVPVLLLVVLVVAVTAQIPEGAGLPAGVQVRLEQYLHSRHALGKAVVLSVTRARQPWHFSQDMSYAVLGDSVYFQIDLPLTWQDEGGPSPLPFPPKELWCALLEGEDRLRGEPTYAVVFVGLHMDMYSGDWMIHEGPTDWSLPVLLQGLSSIGCDFKAVP
ncbi:MAG: hypothetical protein P8189_24710 [Anaerolineae bacterium]